MVIRGRRKSSALLAFAVLQAVPYVTHAQVTATWIGPTDRQMYLSWADPRNWSTNPHVPGDGDAVVFPASDFPLQFVAMPASPVTVSKLEISSKGMLQLDGAIAFNGPAIVDVSGNTMAHAWMPRYYGSPNLPAIITTNGFVKDGDGVINARGLSLVTGGITISNGTLVAGGNYILPPSVGTITLNGGAVQTDPNGFVLTTGGPFTNPIAIGANGGTLVMDSEIGWFTSYTGDISGSSTLALGKTRAGIFRLRSAQTFSGWARVQNDLDLFDDGAMNNASGFIVTDRILLNSVATANFNRVGDSAPIYLRGGTIEGTGLAGSPGTEQLGPVTLESGLSFINSNADLNLDFRSISRTEHSVLNIGSGGFTARITGMPPELSGAGAAGTPEVGIVPWARGTTGGAQPMTVDSGVIRALSAVEFIATVPVSDTASNLKLMTSAAVASNAKVNSLTIWPSVSSLTVNGGGSLTISSGAMFLQGSTGNTTTTIDVPLHFGSNEAILHTSTGASTGTVVLAGPISGSGGLTLAGTIHFSGASIYTGPTTINGRLILSDNVAAGIPGPLGLSVSPVIINSSNAASMTPVVHGITYYPPTDGTLLFDRDMLVRSDNPVAYNSLTVASQGSGSGSVEVAGNIQLDGALSLAGQPESSPSAFVVSARISGPGRLANLSNVTLTGDNDFTGGVVLQSGTVILGSNTALGSGTVWITEYNSPYLAASKPITLSNSFVFMGVTRIGGNQPITLAGSADVQPSYDTLQLEITNTAPTTLAMQIPDVRLEKRGAGLLQLSELPTASIRVADGTLRLLPKESENKANVVTGLDITASNGAQLELTNNDLIIDFGSGSPTAYSRIESAIRAGRITTSMAADGHALGYANNAILGLSMFSGEAVDSTCALIKYTYAGDSNLDGLVDAVDLAALASHWQQGAQTWITGDFNYDARVDIADLYLLASNFRRGSGGAGLAGALSSVGLDASLVPEPSSAAAVGALSLVILLQRRRRHPIPL